MPSPSSALRLMSLDLFRGATIAGMILVNNAGDEPNSYWPLGVQNGTAGRRRI